MKKLLFVFLVMGLITTTDAQTNIFPSTGNVGVGTNSPTSLFSVGSSSPFRVNMYGEVVMNSLTSNGFQVFSHNDQYFSFNRPTSGDFGYMGTASNTTGGPATDLGIRAENNLRLGIGNNTSMTLVAGGNVGIGTSAPNALLSVGPSSQFQVDSYGAVSLFSLTSRGNQLFANNDQYFTFNRPASGDFGYMGTASNTTGGPATDFGIRAENNLRLGIGNKTSMLITFDEKIGIGTTTPSEKLSVNGNISAKKVIVTQAGWSDYVFKDEYKLRSLSSLETYIKQNRHLPEVPSSKEVEDKGISVGDNQALLLKKIEELTLYIIAMNKKAHTQQKEIEILKKRMGIITGHAIK